MDNNASPPPARLASPVKLLQVLYLIGGAALFVALLLPLDVKSALSLLWQAEPLGIAALCLAYFMPFSIDALVLLALVPELPYRFGWYRRLARVRLVGEAFNLVVPAGGFGGEPLKALLLKSHYGVGYRESSTGLGLARIQSLIGQCLFLAFAVVPMAATADLPQLCQASAWIGLGVMGMMTAGFIVTPKLRLSSRLGRRFGGRSWTRSFVKSLAAIEAVEEKINAFARAHRARYAVSI